MVYNKLQDLNISGKLQKWWYYLLTEWRKIVTFKGTLYEEIQMLSGVHHVGIVGLMLFLIAFLDMFTIILTATIICFAKWSKFSKAMKTSTCHQKLTAKQVSINKWAEIKIKKAVQCWQKINSARHIIEYPAVCLYRNQGHCKRRVTGSENLWEQYVQWRVIGKLPNRLWAISRKVPSIYDYACSHSTGRLLPVVIINYQWSLKQSDASTSKRLKLWNSLDIGIDWQSYSFFLEARMWDLYDKLHLENSRSARLKFVDML